MLPSAVWEPLEHKVQFRRHNRNREKKRERGCRERERHKGSERERYTHTRTHTFHTRSEAWVVGRTDPAQNGFRQMANWPFPLSVLLSHPLIVWRF